MNFLSKLKPIGQSVLTVVATLVIIKLVKPYLPTSVQNWLP